jgi:hypothetical protein
VESQAPLPPLTPPSLLPPFPLALGGGGQGEGRRKGGGREEEGRRKGGGREEEGEGGVSGRKGGGGLEEGVHGLGPCTTPSLGCPPKDMLKLDHFSISFGDFSSFL